jgi:hypothetical protein
MLRTPKGEKPSAEVLAPIPAEILDRLVREGPLTAAEHVRAPLIAKHERRFTGFATS